MKVLRQPLRLAEGLFLVYCEQPHHDSGNVYAVVANDGTTTLVDCGSEASSPRVEAALLNIDVPLSKVNKVVATHGDADHILGFHYLMKFNQEVLLYIHQNDWLPIIEGDSVLTKSYLYGKGFKSLPADRCIPLRGNQQILLGDKTGMFIHTPGHSSGSGCILAEFGGEVWLFAGDTVGGALIDCSLVGTNACVEYFLQWQNSLMLLSQLQFDWVLTGHDPYPMSRVEFDRRLTRFGQMLNPWFMLDEDQEEPGNLILPNWLPAKTPSEKAVAD